MNPAMKILVVDDDTDASAALAEGLRGAGYTVEVAHDGMRGMERALLQRFDLVIADRAMPRLDGLQMVQALRHTGRDMPVIFLSALGVVEERIRGLKAGADDYLVKPFSLEELLTRIEVVMRRKSVGESADSVVRIGDLELDRMHRVVRRGGVSIPLQPREYRIIEYLARYPDQVVTRSALFQAVWDYQCATETNVIDVHISRLRQKIDRDFGPRMIHTVRGEGYMIRTGN